MFCERKQKKPLTSHSDRYRYLLTTQHSTFTALQSHRIIRMDAKLADQAIEGKLVKLGYSFPEKWQKRYYSNNRIILRIILTQFIDIFALSATRFTTGRKKRYYNSGTCFTYMTLILTTGGRCRQEVPHNSNCTFQRSKHRSHRH